MAKKASSDTDLMFQFYLLYSVNKISNQTPKKQSELSAMPHQEAIYLHK